MAPSPSRPIITLEEHFLSAAARRKPADGDPTNTPVAGTLDIFDALPHIYELGPERLADMDAGAVTMQVISHGPVDLNAADARACNDQLAAAVRANPGRFAGFAELAMEEPAEAAAELRRTVGECGFVGALVSCHTAAGGYYEGAEYDVLWTAAVELDVPVYIHPTWPSEQVYEVSKSAVLSQAVNTGIMAFGWGWHSDVAVHMLRLYAAGVFDRFPKLKIIIGHFGEMIPFMLGRIKRIAAQWGRERAFGEVWDANIWLTTSGNWSLDPMACILRNTAKDRIMYSVDYPFAKSKQGLEWLEELEASGMVSAEELEGIRWRNAVKLLRLDVKAV